MTHPSSLEINSDTHTSHTLTEAIHLHKNGQTEEAKIAYRNILQQEATNIVAMNNLSLLCDNHTAKSLLLKSLEINPNYIDALINISLRLISDSEITTAKIYLKKLNEIANDDYLLS